MSTARPTGTLAALWVVLAAVSPGASLAAQEVRSRGDAAWERRADGQVDGIAQPGPIGEAIAAFDEALRVDPRDLEARWKLQRALYFRGEYAAVDRATRLAAFTRGRDLGEEGLDLLAAPLGGREVFDALAPAALAARLEDRSLAAETYFWTAVHWGLWGRTRGKMAAVRQGVATTVRDYAERVTALDEAIQDGGGHRLLGRLHFEAPKVPFLTGWVSKERAVAELTLAHRLAPHDLLARLYLSEALLESQPARRSEALALLRGVASATPRPELLVEEIAAAAAARRLLAALGHP